MFERSLSNMQLHPNTDALLQAIGASSCIHGPGQSFISAGDDIDCQCMAMKPLQTPTRTRFM
jgi:hypothetical protein